MEPLSPCDRRRRQIADVRGLGQRRPQALAGALAVRHQPLDARRPDAARRNIDDAPQCHLIARVGGDRKVGERVPHFLALEEGLATHDPERDVLQRHVLFEDPTLDIGTIQDGDRVLRHALGDEPLDLVDDERRLVLAVAAGDHVDRLAGAVG